ncbi:MAG: hypothetical protein HYU66_18370 [Armatimonadetes bacterium]|nr:hypothetical protein [Armatimonadota bacterium]
MRKLHFVLLTLLAARSALPQANLADLDSVTAFATGNWQECLDQTARLLGPNGEHLNSPRRSAALARAAVCCAMLGEDHPAVKALREALTAGDVYAAVLVDRLAPILGGRWDQLDKLLDAANHRYDDWPPLRRSLGQAVDRLGEVQGELAERAGTAARTMREALLYLDALAAGYLWSPDYGPSWSELAEVAHAPAEQRERALAILRRALLLWREGRSSRRLTVDIERELISRVSSDAPDAETLQLGLELLDDRDAFSRGMEQAARRGWLQVGDYALRRLVARFADDPALFSAASFARGSWRFPRTYTVGARELLRELVREAPYPARREIRRILMATYCLPGDGKGQELLAVELDRCTAEAERAPQDCDALLALADATLCEAARRWENCTSGPEAVEDYARAAGVYAKVLAQAREPGVVLAAWTGLAEADPAQGWAHRDALAPCLEVTALRRWALLVLTACGLGQADWRGVREYSDALSQVEPVGNGKLAAAAVRALCGDEAGADALYRQIADPLPYIGDLLSPRPTYLLYPWDVPSVLEEQARRVLTSGERIQALAGFVLQRLTRAAAEAPDAERLGLIYSWGRNDDGSSPAVAALHQRLTDTSIDWLRRRPDLPEGPVQLLWSYAFASGEQLPQLSIAETHRLVLACLDLARERALPGERVHPALCRYSPGCEPTPEGCEQRAELVLEARSHYP